MDDELKLKVSVDTSEVKKLNEVTKAIDELGKNTSVSEKSMNKLTQTGKSMYATLSKSTDPLKDFARTQNKLAEKLSKSLFAKSVSKSTSETAKYNKAISMLAAKQKELLKISQMPFIQDNLEQLKQTVSAQQQQALEQKKTTVATTSSSLALQQFEESLDKQAVKLKKAKLALISWENSFKQSFSSNDVKGVKIAESNIAKLSKRIEVLSSYQKKSTSFQKLLYRIKNISIYRMIRTGLHWIVSGLQEGVNKAVLMDKTFNKSMTNITHSFSQVRHAAAVSFLNLMQVAEPVLVALSNALLTFTESFNVAMARMRGDTTFLSAAKGIRDYATAVNDAGNSFSSFDKFNALSSGADVQYEEKNLEDVDDATSALAHTWEEIFKVVKEIVDLLKTVFTDLIIPALPLINDIINRFLDDLDPLIKPLGSILQQVLSLVIQIWDVVEPIVTTLFDIVIEALPPVIELISAIIETMKPALLAIAQIVSGVIKPAFYALVDILKIVVDLFRGDLKSVAKDFGNFFIDTLNSVWGAIKWLIQSVINAIQAMINGLLSPINKVVKKFGGKQIKVDWSNTTASWGNIPRFADGGFTTANFIATNENGEREWVGKNGNASAVVNDTQMSEIMYKAVKDGCFAALMQSSYTDTGNNTSSSKIILQVDKDVLGRVVAESSGFINEVNRRNVALELR